MRFTKRSTRRSRPVPVRPVEQLELRVLMAATHPAAEAAPPDAPTLLALDQFEPNDTLATATNFGALGDRTNSGLTIHDTGNNDYYRFATPSSGTLTVTLNFTHAAGDIDMRLLDTNGVILGSSTTTGNVETITRAVNAGDVYVVQVYGFNGAQNGYSMTIDAPDLPLDRFEFNDTVATARNLGSAGDRSFPDLSIHAANNNDYYRVTTAAAGSLTVSLAFTHAFGDVDMQLLDAAGGLLLSSSSTGNSESITRAVSAGENYIIRVYGFNGATNPDYDMTVNGPDIAADRFEPNDSRAAAHDFGTLGDRTDNGLSIHASGNEDYYKFIAGSTGPLNVGLTFTHALGDVDMQLQDSAGASLATSSGTGNAENITFNVTQGQTYFLRVYGFNGSINPSYSMTIDGPPLPADYLEANDTLATARNLGAAGDRVFANLNIHAPNNDDYYRLTTTGAGNLTVSLSFTHDFGDVDMQLLDSAGAVLATSSGTGNAESITRSGVAAGQTYYVKVYGFAGMTNPDYDLTINGPDIAPDRFEPNDTRATAANLGALGDRIENGLSVHQSGNDDWYQFTASSTGSVTIGLAFTHALGDVDMQLTDGGGAVLATSNSTTSAETITQPVTGGQTYYVRVYGFGGAINPFYNMTIDGPAPVPASEVYVRGSTWSANFKTYMEAQGLGDDVLGYRVDNTAGNDVVPWVNVDEVVLRYSSPPTGSGIPTPGTVTLDGIRSDYTVSSVTALDPQTFVLRLDRALGVLPNPPGGENGDRVTLSAPGGPGGAAFSRRINVLQGDVDKSGSVVAADFSDVKNRFFRTTAAPGPAGPTQYNVFRDVDGSGGILANDFSLVKARFFDNLPPAPPLTAPAATVPVASALFGTKKVLA